MSFSKKSSAAFRRRAPPPSPLFPGGGAASSDPPPPLFPSISPLPTTPPPSPPFLPFSTTAPSSPPFLSPPAAAAETLSLLAVASSCPNLRQLRFLGSPVSPFSLYTLSASCLHLSSISISISRPLSFHWLLCFTSLKCLSIFLSGPLSEIDNLEMGLMKDSVFGLELCLESLSLSGILIGDSGLGSLWRNCKHVKKLQLKSCESVGDYNSFSSFLKSLNCLQEVELIASRRIVDRVLLNLAEDCVSLDSLLVHDGGSKEGLLQFINQCKCSLKRLYLRLPLDLDNTHLIALAQNPNFRGLVSLRLENCCLVSGEGLKAMAMAIGSELEDLALINCDVVEKESGLLSSLGQGLKRLRNLDLSDNEMLLDKELVSMLVSCGALSELKLRRCSRLSNAALDSVIRSCEKVESVDVMCCCGIGVEGVESLLVNSVSLRRVEVELRKLSGVARTLVVKKSIEVFS